MNCGDAARQSVFNLPEDSSSKINIMFHESHSTIFGPTFFIIVTNDVLIVRIGILSKESLNQFSGLISHKPENYLNMIDISHIHSDRMTCLNFNGLKEDELIFIFRRTC